MTLKERLCHYYLINIGVVMSFISIEVMKLNGLKNMFESNNEVQSKVVMFLSNQMLTCK